MSPTSSTTDGPSASARTRLNRGIAWVGLASSLVALLDIAAMWIVLRTWISPAEFGVATIVATLFPILDLATDMGLSAAFIQKDVHTVEMMSTVFWINLAMSLAIAALLFPAGQLLAAFHGRPVVATMLAAYGGKLVFQNVYFIPQAMMRREFRFKELSIIRVFANMAEFVGKVGFAAAGFGVWMFVLAPMGRILVTGIGIQLRHPWRPRWVLELANARSYVAFGLKTSASQILLSFYTNFDYQVVGKYFGAAALGHYRWAYELVLEPVRIISGVVVEVAFPAFARLRQRRKELVAQFIAFTRQNLLIAIPFLAVVFLAADEILMVIFGPSWVASATAARVLCAVGVLRAMSLVMPPLLDGMGYPSLTLLYMIVASTVLPAMYVLFAAWLGPSVGYLSVAISWAVGYPVAFAVLAFMTLKRIELPALEYLRRIIGIPLCAAAAMLAGLGARVLLRNSSEGIRLLAVIVVTVTVLALLLAYTQGLSLRTAVRALRGGSDEPKR